MTTTGSTMDIDTTDDTEDTKRNLDERNLITYNEVEAVFATIFQELQGHDLHSTCTTVKNPSLSMKKDDRYHEDDHDDEIQKLDTISRSLLRLYEMQHIVHDTLQRQESELEEDILHQNHIQQQSMEHQYEQLYLMQQIQYYEELFNTETFPSFIQFAKEEMGAAVNGGVNHHHHQHQTTDSSNDVSMSDTSQGGEISTTSTTIDCRSSSSSSSSSDTTSDKEIVKQFLASHGLNIDSIEDRTKIMNFIQTRMQDRTVLLEKIQQETKEIQLLRQEYNVQNDLLTNSIPTHIQTLERAANAFSKVLYSTSSLHTKNNNINSNSNVGTTKNSGSSTGSSIQHMTGTDRFARIQMAQQLSSVPLYTIYQSIQHYLDVVQTQVANENNNNNSSISSSSSMIETNNNNMTIGKVTIDTHLNEVILHLPVLDVAAVNTTAGTAITNKNKKVTMVSIHFVHNTSPIPYITVYCSGCAPLLNQDILLDELFPNDVAMNDTILQSSSVTPPHPTSNVTKSAPPQPTTTTNNSNNNSTRGGKSYLWCNHLAGLYPVPFISNDGDTNSIHSTATTKIQQQHVSTHVVIHEIQRRIRANATLKYILHSLCRSRVPTPPLQAFIADTTTSSSQYNTFSIIYTDLNWKAQCKLINFSAATANPATTPTPPSTTTYNVEIRRNGNVAVTTSAVSPVFTCTVQISNTRYPGIVPIWDFSNRSSTLKTMDARNDDTEQFYDTHMAQLSHRVNVEILGMIQIISQTHQREPESSHDHITGEDINIMQFCEWIIVHQLREIMHFVDSMPEQDVTDPMEYPIAYKGRDRQIR